MSSVLAALKAIFAALPVLEKLLKLFIKTPQEEIKKGVEDARSEIDEFKKTGRPPK